jgi:hypothetical protein
MIISTSVGCSREIFSVNFVIISSRHEEESDTGSPKFSVYSNILSNFPVKG